LPWRHLNSILRFVAARRRTFLFASLVGAAIFAAAAFAAATPRTLRPAATVRTAHPDFTWTDPLNEESVAIYIANKPDVTPAGAFYSANWVDGAEVLPGDGEWSPSRGLSAGRYWWNVLTTDPSTSAFFYSPPSEFTIPVALRLYGVAAKRFSSPRRRLWVVVRASANVKHPLFRLRLGKGGRVVWNVPRTADGSIRPGAHNFYWYPGPRVKQGTRLNLTVSISSGGVTRTRSIAVRAP